MFHLGTMTSSGRRPERAGNSSAVWRATACASRRFQAPVRGGRRRTTGSVGAADEEQPVFASGPCRFKAGRPDHDFRANCGCG